MDNNNVRRTVLANGIILLTETIPHVRSVSIGVWVKNGSRYEPPALQGASHFIEHLLFKGTQTRNAREIAFAIDSLGGHLDAFTGREFTCYYARIMDEHLFMAIELLADIVLNPLFEPKELEVERQVILEEIRTTEDSPDDYIHDLFAQTVWKTHPLGQPILGTNETIGNITQSEIVNFYKNSYYSENIVIVAAGNLDHQKLQDKVENLFQNANSSPENPVSMGEKLPVFNKQTTGRLKDLEQVHLCIGTNGVPYADKQRFTCYILNTLLGGGMSSRLFQKIREERGLAYSIYSYFVSYYDAGSFATYAGTAAANSDEVIGLIIDEFKKAKTIPIEEEELQKSKEQLKGSLMLSMESTTNRMTTLAKYEIYFKRQYSLDEILARIKEVTPDDLQALSKNLFQTNLLSMVYLGPPKMTAPDEKLLIL